MKAAVEFEVYTFGFFQIFEADNFEIGNVKCEGYALFFSKKLSRLSLLLTPTLCTTQITATIQIIYPLCDAM